MPDPATPLQLPAMPTAISPGRTAGQSLGAAIRAPVVGAVQDVADAGKAVAGTVQQAPSFFGGLASGLVNGDAPPAPAPVPVTPGAAPTAAANPYAPGGVVPPIASPEAMAAFHSSLVADPAQIVARAAANNAAAAQKDPLSGQIRFIDQNSPKVAAPTGGNRAAPEPITNRDVDATNAMIPQRISQPERAQAGLMDIYEANHNAQMELAEATARGDADAIKSAQAKINLTDPSVNKALATHIQNLRSIALPNFGTMEATQQSQVR